MNYLGMLWIAFLFVVVVILPLWFIFKDKQRRCCHDYEFMSPHGTWSAIYRCKKCNLRKIKRM